MSNAPVTAALMIIGNEILSGRTKDANLPFLAEALNKVGIRLMEARVVPDIEADIIAGLDALRQRWTYVFTTGGIGPTHDDITSACIAKAFGVKLIRHPDAVALLESHYQPGDLTEARLKMAEVPEGATLIHNPVSKAPGFQMDNVFVLAGVPSICRAMFDGLRDRLQGGAPMLSCMVTCGLGEGRIAADLSAVQDRYPDVEIGSYPYFRGGAFGTSLVSRGTDAERLAFVVADLFAMIRAHGGEPTEENPA